MKTLLGIVLGLSCLAFLPASVMAEERPPKEMVEDLSKMAYDGLLTVKNAEGQTIVKPEDAKKLKHPMISYEEREMAVVRGNMSGLAKWCGLKWQKDFFIPYMTSLRKEYNGKWTEHQFAYAEVLHGVAMAVAEKGKEGEKCSSAEKKRLSDFAKK